MSGEIGRVRPRTRSRAQLDGGARATEASTTGSSAAASTTSDYEGSSRGQRRSKKASSRARTSSVAQHASSGTVPSGSAGEVTGTSLPVGSCGRQKSKKGTGHRRRPASQSGPRSCGGAVVSTEGMVPLSVPVDDGPGTPQKSRVFPTSDNPLVSRDPHITQPVTPGRVPASAPPVLDFTPPSAAPDHNISLHDSKERDRDDINEERSQQLEGLSVGPVTLEMWSADETITPPASRSDPSVSDSFTGLAREIFEKVSKTHGEAGLCAAIIASEVCKNLHPTDTHVTKGKDINDTNRSYAPDFALLDSLLPKDMDPALRAMIILDMMELWGDQKANHEDSHGGLSGTVRYKTRDTQISRRSRGQFISYSIVMFSNSFRTSVQAFLILGEDARLFRYDRAGVIFTGLFKWRTTPHLLNFLSSFDAMTPAQRGRDTSVKSIHYDSREARRARRIFRKALSGGQLPHGIDEETVFPNDKTHLNLILQYCCDTRTFHRIVVHHPMEYNTSNALTSDGARYWIAVDIDNDLVLTMKEHWRVDLPDMPSETERQACLARAGVSHIPEVYFGSDVPEDSDGLYKRSKGRPLDDAEHEALTFQSTYTNKFCEAHQDVDRKGSNVGQMPNEQVQIRPRVLHRVLYKTVFRRMETFRSAKEFVQVMHDVTQAHAEAYEKAGLLHRYITPSCIRIDKDGRGLLTNWDQSVFWRTHKGARTSTRPHNWAFLSSTLLQNPTSRPHLLRDDIEGIVYILHYFILRFIPLQGEQVYIDVAHEQVQRALRAIFEEASTDSKNRVKGGNMKAVFLGGGSSALLEWGNLNGLIKPNALWELLSEARGLFHGIYASPPQDLTTLGARRPGAIEAHERQVEEWKQNREQAEQTLESHESLLLVFKAYLSDEYSEQWATASAPKDKYPMEARTPYGPRVWQGNHASVEPNGSKRTRPADYDDAEVEKQKRQKFDQEGALAPGFGGGAIASTSGSAMDEQ